jgi:hypothetical protein
MANSFRNKTRKNISTEYFVYNNNADGNDLGDKILLETGVNSGETTSSLALESYANTVIYTCADSTTCIIVSISLINKSTDTIGAYLFLNSDTNQTKTVDGSSVTETNENITIFNNVPIPAYTTLEISSGQKYVLNPTDAIVARTSSPGGLDVFISMLEIT